MLGQAGSGSAQGWLPLDVKPCHVSLRQPVRISLGPGFHGQTS